MGAGDHEMSKLSDIVTLAPVSHKVLDRSVSELNFRAIVDGLGEVRFLQLRTALVRT
jgi:hypothetical protein